MLPVSTRAPVELVPEEYSTAAREALEAQRNAAASDADEVLREQLACKIARFDAPPTYLIGVPTIPGRARYRRAMLQVGAQAVSDAQLLDVLEESIEHVVMEVDRSGARDVVRQARGQLDGDGDTLSDEVIDALQRLQDLAQRQHPPYAALTAERRYWWDMSLYHAALHFLVGWRNVDAEFRFGRDGLVAPECLERIPEDHQQEIGIKALTLMRPTEDERKN